MILKYFILPICFLILCQILTRTKNSCQKRTDNIKNECVKTIGKNGTLNRKQFLNIESFVKIQKTNQNNWDTLYKDYPRIPGYRDTKIPRKCTVIPTINRLWPLPSPSTPDSSLFRIFSLHLHPCFTKN